MRNALLPLLVLALGAAWFAVPASAQDQKPVPDMGLRYELQPHEEGFVRLNRETGAVSFCRVLTGSLICRLGAEEREAYEEKITSLEDRLDSAEERIDALEAGVAKNRRGGNDRTTESEEKEPGPSSPSELDKEFDEAMEIARTAMQRFFEAVQDLRSEFENR